MPEVLFSMLILYIHGFPFFGSFVLSTSLYGKNSLGLKVFGGQVILPMVGQMNADVTNCQGGGVGGRGGLFQYSGQQVTNLLP